jgi:hypothetical protein
MAAYTWDEMTDILLAYSAADGNGRMAQRLYQERFPNRWNPHHSTFASINRRLRETGSLNVNRHDFLEHSLPELLEDVPLYVRRKMWFMHNGAAAHFSMYAREYMNAVFPARWSFFFWPARSPDLNPLDFFVWGHPRCLIFETPVEREDDLLPRIQAACDNIRQDTRYFRASATVNGASLRVVQWSRLLSLWTAAVVVAVLKLKCLIIILCQCYLYTITMSSINYVRVLQSRFETSFLPLKKALSAVPCYLR